VNQRRKAAGGGDTAAAPTHKKDGLNPDQLPNGSLVVNLVVNPVSIVLNGQPTTDTIAVLSIEKIDAFLNYEGNRENQGTMNLLTIALPSASLRVDRASSTTAETTDAPQPGAHLIVKSLRGHLGQAYDAVEERAMHTGLVSIRSIGLDVSLRKLEELNEFMELWFRPLRTSTATVATTATTTPTTLTPGARTPASLSSPASEQAEETEACDKTAILAWAQVNKLIVVADLGEALGTAKWNVRDLQLGTNDPQGYADHISSDVTGRAHSVGFDRLDLKLTRGRLRGETVLLGAYSHANATFPLRRPAEGVSAGERPTRFWSVELSRAASNLDYDQGVDDMDKILNFKLDGAVMRVGDKKVQSLSGSDQCVVRSEFHYNGLTLLISSETLPALIRIASLVGEQIVVQRPTRRPSLHSTGSNVSRAVDDVLDDDVFDIATEPTDVTVGEVLVNGRATDAQLYNYSIEPQADFLRVHVTHVVADLRQRQVTKEIHRMCRAQFTTSGVTKMASTVSRSKGSILLVPHAYLSLNTVQKLGSPMVDCEFDTSFNRSIDVATNIQLYNYIRQLGQLYAKELATARAGARPKSRKFKSVAASMNAGEAIEYRCRKFKLEPLLSVLGDATPKVDSVLSWLGITDRDVIINAIHAGLSRGLERALTESARGLNKFPL